MAKRLAGALPGALVGIVAVLSSFLTMYLVGLRMSAGPSVGIVSAVLALTLARKPRDSRKSPWYTFAMLPLVAVASALVGLLLETIPALGAALFIAAIFLSVWLRQFGATATTIGSLIALPFVVMLMVPVPPNAPGGPLINIALIVCAGVVALGWTTIVRFVAARIGFTTDGPLTVALPAEAPRASGGGLSVSTRMALQMGVALVAAFAVGFLFFGQHWGWVVITAFIVCSGARGRGDAAYKGLLRLGGALAGTIVAALVQNISLPSGVAAACAIFAALFLGLWLREINYAYWAACITLVLALLQNSENAAGLTLLVERLEGIFVGALCGVAATWVVFPIRTESIVRRRVAEVLVALDDLLHGGHATADARAHRLAVLEHRVAEMDRVAPPVELHRRVFARSAEEHPAVWIGIVRKILRRARERANAFRHNDHEPTRQAIRDSRRSIGKRLTPEEMEAAGDAPVTASLRRVHDALADKGDLDAAR